MKFAVIDVETTGLNPDTGSIIELGIIIIHDGSVVSEYSWLINPGRPIPAIITRLTGIGNEIVKRQPRFETIAPIIDELLRNHIIVGHNVLFDYSFLKNEMSRCRIPFSRKILCTKEFSEFMIPGKPSYSLKAICNLFEIKNSNPHRALPDAQVTAQIFLRYYLEMGEGFIKNLYEKKNPSRLIPEHLKNTINKELPSKPGVYYFIGNANKPFYIGKAINIKQRILTHFRGDGNSLKILVLANSIKEIRYQETGHELIAALLEDHEIRHFWPRANYAQKHRINRYGVVTYLDQLNRWRMAVTRGGKSTILSTSFHQYHLAADYIGNLTKKYNLDSNLCGIPTLVEIELNLHNNNFTKMMEEIQNQPVVTTVYYFDGRKKEEKSFILLENGFYKGFGFIDVLHTENPSELYQQLTLRYSSVTTENIIHQLIQKSLSEFSFEKLKGSIAVEN